MVFEVQSVYLTGKHNFSQLPWWNRSNIPRSMAVVQRSLDLCWICLWNCWCVTLKWWFC